MSLLSYTEICELIEDGVITGASYEAVNSASLDITLGDTYLAERIALPSQVLCLDKKDTLPTVKVTGQDIILEPGEFILAQSVEVFNLPNNISAEYKLKSSMARIGLEHLNAGWCDAGWHGSVLTLELKNMLRKHYIKLAAGNKIGQLVFFRHEEVPADKSYAERGSYNKDTTVHGVKVQTTERERVVSCSCGYNFIYPNFIGCPQCGKLAKETK